MMETDMIDKQRAAQSLAQFCIAQRGAFDSREWLARKHIDGKAVALAAKYLSMTSWYGHEDELERIAVAIYARSVGEEALFSESKSQDFDLPYFSTTVRICVAQIRTERPPLTPAAQSAGPAP
jgi:hypothetical protein